MKSMNLRGFTKRRRSVTTKRSTTNPVVADLVKRRFHAGAANQVHVGDITYLPCKNGTNRYLATVIHLYSRKLVGFAIADHMRTGLVIEALDHANTVRGGLHGAIFHSDHGSMYTSSAFGARCSELGVPRSIGAVGTSADNARGDSFNATMKKRGSPRKESLLPIHCTAGKRSFAGASDTTPDAGIHGADRYHLTCLRARPPESGHVGGQLCCFGQCS